MPHPEYNWETLDNDFILLKLVEKVDFGQLPHVYPACWPSYEPTGNQQLHGDHVRRPYVIMILTKNKTSFQALVSGWGLLKEDGDSPNILQEVSNAHKFWEFSPQYSHI